jgi:hypothetical protein
VLAIQAELGPFFQGLSALPDRLSADKLSQGFLARHRFASRLRPQCIQDSLTVFFVETSPSEWYVARVRCVWKLCFERVKLPSALDKLVDRGLSLGLVVSS